MAALADCAGVPHPARVSPGGIMVAEPVTDDEVNTTWRGDPFEQDLGSAGKPRCYPEVKIDNWVLRDGDVIYATPSEQGSSMEIGIIEGLFVGKDSDNEECKNAYLRWFWPAKDVQHSLKDVHAREIFISDTYNEWPLEGIEGCALEP